MRSVSNNFHFEIVSTRDLESCIALTIAVTNLPESPDLIADENYNYENGLRRDNEVKFPELGIDVIELNQAAKDFLQSYVKQQGLENQVEVVLDGNWTSSGFDTQADLSIKTDAWLENRISLAKKLTRLTI